MSATISYSSHWILMSITFRLPSKLKLSLPYPILAMGMKLWTLLPAKKSSRVSEKCVRFSRYPDTPEIFLQAPCNSQLLTHLGLGIINISPSLSQSLLPHPLPPFSVSSTSMHLSEGRGWFYSAFHSYSCIHDLKGLQFWSASSCASKYFIYCELVSLSHAFSWKYYVGIKSLHTSAKDPLLIWLEIL